MSSLPPPRDTDQDWLDEAILAAILSLQFANTAGIQSEALMMQASAEIKAALRSYNGRNPRRLISKIQGIIANVSRKVERQQGASIAVLAALEATSLGVTQKSIKPSMEVASVNGLTPKAAIKKFLSGFLSTDLIARIKELVRAGMTGRQMVDAIQPVLDTAERSAATVTRTRAAAAAAQARLTVAKRNGRKLMWVSVLDDRTTIQCANLDGETWLASEPHVMPPLHPNCRSSVVVVEGPRPKRNKTFEEWLQDQPEAVQNEVLGVARAKAWRSGALPIRKMVDATRTRPISVSKLRKMGRI